MKKTISILFIVALTFCFAIEMIAQEKQSKEPEYPGMVKIPAGSFQMGSNDGYDNEKPIHTVNISEFYMDKFEVTNHAYKKCVSAGKCNAPKRSNSVSKKKYYTDPFNNNHPVLHATWDDAEKYCIWNGKRLPTEAEWEYAARGGLVGARYPNGDSITCGDANFARSGENHSCANYRGRRNDVHRVGSYKPNGYGLYDMAGNVREYCSDYYGENYYSNSPASNPKGPSKGVWHVLRDGSWGGKKNHLRVSKRSRDLSQSLLGGTNFIGFRCAR
jgi:formylglycine-generating enzyme required for sulfatase activity